MGYRAWAMRAAAAFGLRGWVRNRGDGTVEMLVIGPDAAVTAMIVASRRGPRAAEVEDVEIMEAADDGSAGFTVRQTQ